MEEEIQKIDVCKELIEKTEELMEAVIQDGIDTENVKFLGEIVDIHKDIKNEKYWEEKIDTMRYSRGYGNYGDDMYGRGRSRDSRGRYNESGRSGRYRGHDYIDSMSDYYGRYEDGRSRYGTDESSMKSLKEMLRSVEDFMAHLENEASSQEEVSMIKETADRISRM